MPVSSAERRAYIRKMREITSRLDRVSADVMKRELALLKDFRDRIAGELTAASALPEPSDFTLYRLRSLRTNLERMIAELETGLRQLLAGGVRDAYALGSAGMIEPLIEVGVNVPWFQPTMAQVNVLADFSADLITKISAETLAKINQEIALAGLGGRTPWETMNAITRILGMKGRELTGVAYRAEMITRTELMRAHNMAGQSTLEMIGQRLPGMRKRWIHSGKPKPRLDHIGMHVYTYDHPIPYNEPYVFPDGSRLMQPLDPAGPAHQVIACGCTQSAVTEEIGIIPSPLDEATRDLEELIKTNGGKLPK